MDWGLSGTSGVVVTHPPTWFGGFLRVRIPDASQVAGPSSRFNFPGSSSLGYCRIAVGYEAIPAYLVTIKIQFQFLLLLADTTGSEGVTIERRLLYSRMGFVYCIVHHTLE